MQYYEAGKMYVPDQTAELKGLMTGLHKKGFLVSLSSLLRAAHAQFCSGTDRCTTTDQETNGIVKWVTLLSIVC